MKTQDFTTSFSVAATPRQVFDAINNVRGWWSQNIDGETDQQNAAFKYHYQDVHRATMRITELIPNKRIVWHVVENHFKFTKDKTEWTGTDIIFEISAKGSQTELKFTHEGLVPEYECYQLCHDAWTHYIQDSLKDLILTGTGKPTPAETEMEDLKGTPEEDAGPGNAKAICHRLLIKSPVEKVYEALTTEKGLSGWWTPETKAKPEIGSIARFSFNPGQSTNMEILELKPYSLVKWRCVEAQQEWIGTTLSFELEPHAKGTILNFRHGGWKQYTREFSSCSYVWALFFRSLKFLCETGKGFPFPDFEK